YIICSLVSFSGWRVRTYNGKITPIVCSCSSDIAKENNCTRPSSGRRQSVWYQPNEEETCGFFALAATVWSLGDKSYVGLHTVVEEAATNSLLPVRVREMFISSSLSSSTQERCVLQPSELP
ncbi:hypothetical protein J6590_053196, partial [Homalodisca vitripennis]